MELGRIEKTLFSFDYPEFKVSTCVTGWTYMPCGSLLNPKMCKKDIKVPCTKTKTSRFRIYILVTYPDSAEQVVRDAIDRCHDLATGVAIGIITKAATASTVVGPQATIAAAIGAIGPAAAAYGNSFYGCLAAVSMPDVIRNNIKAEIQKEDKGLTGWREYHDNRFMYSQYDIQQFFPYNYY